MDNKYYEPSITDLFEGYVFEARVYNEDTDEYSDLWVMHEFDSRDGLGDDLTHQFEEGTVRVAYITPEDIESGGWTTREPDSIFPIFEKQVNKYEKWDMLLDTRNCEVSISYINNDPYLEYLTDECVFVGKCPSINEFKYVSKLLGI